MVERAGHAFSAAKVRFPRCPLNAYVADLLWCLRSGPLGERLSSSWQSRKDDSQVWRFRFGRSERRVLHLP